MKAKMWFWAWFTMTMLLTVWRAQAQFEVSGSVTTQAGDPLTGVTVAVKGTNIGTTTDEDGQFRLNIPGTTATLVFSYVGFATVEKTVSSDNRRLEVVMVESSSVLEEVIISGLATTVKRSNAANAVAQIDAKQLTGIVPPSTFDGALQGKFPGVQISQNSGAPGGGINIRMRGITSINSATQPLFIIDGVYVDNSIIPPGLNVVSQAAARGSPRQFDQDNAANRIADLDAGDFQTVEILKGPSAAAIYGARAAGGVVIVTTKRGSSSPDAPRVRFSQSLGFQQILNPLGMRQWDTQKVADFYGAGSAEIQKFLDAQAAGKLYDYEMELYGNKGLISDSRLSVMGGNERTAFYASGSHRNEEGIVLNTGYTKTALRLNVDHEISEALEVRLSSNYIKASADRGYFNNDNTGTTMSIALSSTPPWAELHPLPDGSYPNNPYAPSNFLQTRDLITNNESVDRIIMGGTITAKIINTDVQSLKLLLQGGFDSYTLLTRAIFPRELQFQKDGNGTNGASIQGTTPNFTNNQSAILVHTYYTPSFTFRTQGGLTRESFKRNTIIVTATQLIGSQTNVNQAGSISTFQFRSQQLDLGGFIQEEINWDDKVIATLGVRADKSSNNADPNLLYWYPKASLAVNLTRFVDGLDPFSTLKPRIAYGESSNFPPPNAIFTNLNGVIIDGLAGSLVNNQRGNTAIQPERQQELELGVDIGVVQDRAVLELTRYRKVSKDLIFTAAVPPSSGYTTKIVNGGTLENRGWEITLSADLVRTENLSWFSSISWWKNRSEITELNVPAFVTSAFGATLGTFYIDTNRSATQIVGIGDPDLIEPGDEYVVYGDFEPDFQMSFYEDLRYKNWSLTFLIHWKKGGDNINLTQLLTDLGGTSHDYDDFTLDPEGILPNGPYRISQLGVSAAPFVEDASYVRLREVGLFYTLTGEQIGAWTSNLVRSAQIGISARNLLNFFKYNSYDPEVSNFTGNGLASGVEVNPYPSSKSFLVSLNVSF
ncbi:MAG: SusC/RagA family TonB-linked outer membrane protein [Chitinophagales bacterium]|nr:SusC/RagA family TonB-linked outer membrane protein [Chitinophagales bacterium]MDW8428022.1 SusC/RagA family TonB-linked outer membrane protein [Chitinophagales bacterium]